MVSQTGIVLELKIREGGGGPLPPTGITGFVGGGRVDVDSVEFDAVDDVVGPEGDGEGPGCGGVGIPGNLLKIVFHLYSQGFKGASSISIVIIFCLY